QPLSTSNGSAVRNARVIGQEGGPREVYMQQKGKFVANFIRSTNQLAGRVTKVDTDGIGSVKTDEGEISCQLLEGLTVGSNAVVMIRPESINLHTQRPSSTCNLIEGKIGAAMFLGEYVDCTVELGTNVLQTHQRHTLQVRRG